MNTIFKCFLALIIAFGGTVLGAVSEQDLKEGDTVTLVGRLERTWAYGVPGFGEYPESDEVDHYFAIVVTHAICVAGREGDIVKDVSRIQLIVDNRKSKQWGSLSNVEKGMAVAVSGKVSIAYTGHHHERLLLNVESVEPLDRNR